MKKILPAVVTLAAATLSPLAVAGAAHASSVSPHTGVSPMLACSTKGVSSVTRNQAMERAAAWIKEKVPYSNYDCWTDSYGKYRQDCSGYVSMIWGLDTSATTRDLQTYSDKIDEADMRPGDAMVAFDDHAIIFVKWANSSHSSFVGDEESKPGLDALQKTFSLNTLDGFNAYRYKHIIESAEVSASGWSAVGVGGHLHAVAVANGKAYHDYRSDGKWSGWSDLGGTDLGGIPTIMNVGENYQVFALNSKGELQHDIYDADSGKWGDWSHPATPDGKAVTFKAGTGLSAMHVNDHTHVFGISPDNHLLHAWYDGSKWIVSDLGGNIDGTPGAEFHEDSYQVFALSPEGKLFSKSFEDGKWGDWTERDHDGTAVTFKAGTGISAVYVNGHDHVLGVGTDGAPLHAWYDGQWTLTKLTGTAQKTPAIDYNDSGDYDAFAINNNGDYNVKTNHDDEWGSWDDFSHP